MPEIKNQSATDLKVGKVIQPSDLSASIEPKAESPKAVPKPDAATRSKRAPKSIKP